MSKLVVLSREAHAAARFKKPDGYAWVAGEAVLPLLAVELPVAVMSLPLAFVRHEGAYRLVAVLGLTMGRNLFVAADGRWMGGYVPAAARGYPFALAKNEQDSSWVLCFDADSGLIGEAVAGEPVFAEDGTLSQVILQQVEFLQQVEQCRGVTAAACAALDAAGCFKPWPIVLKTSEGERSIDGIFQVNEAALNALDSEGFLALREAGALLVAYCQLLSMRHLPVLGQLLDVHAQAQAPLSVLPVNENGRELDLSFLSDGGVINFSGI